MQRLRILGMMAVTTLVAISLLAGCASLESTQSTKVSSAHQASGKSAPSRRLNATEASGGEAFRIGHDYGSISVMAADLQQDGVWAWASEYPTKSMDTSESRVFHYTKNSGLQSWPLGHGREVLAGSAANPSIVACGSDAWLGINWRLFKIDPNKGIVGSWTIPTIVQNKTLTAQVPPGAEALTAHTLIQAIACSGSTVALAIWHGTNALTFDASTEKFTPVALPENETAASVAVAQDGTVGFGLQNTNAGGPHRLLLYRPQTGVTMDVSVRSSLQLQAVPTQDVLSKEPRPEFITAAGAEIVNVGTDIKESTVTIADAAPAAAGLDPYRSNSVFLPDGRMVLPNSEGVVVTGAKGKDSQLLQLGTRPCGFSSASAHGAANADESTSTEDPAARCPIGTETVAVDASGTIWYPGYLGDGSAIPVNWIAAPID